MNKREIPTRREGRRREREGYEGRFKNVRESKERGKGREVHIGV